MSHIATDPHGSHQAATPGSTNLRLTIAKKLVLGFAAVALVTLLVGAGGYFGLRNAVEQADGITHRIKGRGQFLAQSIDLARSSKEQSSGIGQVTIAVSEMDKVTQANALNRADDGLLSLVGGER